jgi:UDP-hydrolysing UDP-N-acetyl-D-glucosamine 2-epimerase
VSTEGARRRLLALGEEEWRIRVTGAPGLDTLLEAPEMDRAEFLSAVGFAADAAEFRLVTVHPETNSPDPEAPLRAVLGAIESRPAPTLFTAPNADPGGARMRAVIETFVERFEWARFRASLGPVLYPNALRHARMMIGNSSSGVIEAGMFGLPVIDVGERQRGRDRDANVATVPNDVAAVGQAMDRISSDPVRHVGASLYGDGRSGPRIAAVLAELPERRRLLRKSHGPSVAAA